MKEITWQTHEAAREMQAAMDSVARIMEMDAATIAEWRDAAQSGMIHQPDPDALPQAMVECTTEHDWAELPDELKASLREWCTRLREWAQ